MLQVFAITCLCIGVVVVGTDVSRPLSDNDLLHVRGAGAECQTPNYTTMA